MGHEPTNLKKKSELPPHQHSRREIKEGELHWPADKRRVCPMVQKESAGGDIFYNALLAFSDIPSHIYFQKELRYFAQDSMFVTL